MAFTYKKWVIYLFISICFLCLFYQFAIYFLYFPVTTELIWINSRLIQKERFANNIKGNKLLFAGGSATLFGVRTKEIQDDLGIPCVNMAVHASLEIDYYLAILKRSLRKGDVVILALEYPYFNYDGHVISQTADYILCYDRNYFSSLPLKDKIKYLSSISPFSVAIYIQNKLIQQIQGPFIADHYKINSHGDGIDNIGTDKVENMVRFSGPVEIQRKLFVETIGLKLIKHFDLWCKDNGITCYITYANSLYFKEYDNDSYRKFFRELQEYFDDNNILTLGTPYDFFYNKDLFYDTQYHLNQRGATVRTKQLIKMMGDKGIISNFINNHVSEKSGSTSAVYQ